MYKKTTRWSWIGLGMGLLSLSTQSVYAAGTQTFTKELLSGTNPKPGETVQYRFRLACSSLTSDCGNLTVEDTLPAGLEAVSCAAPTGFTVVSCDVSNPVIKVTKDDVFNGGDSFNIDVIARVKLGTSAGTLLANTATSIITAPDTPSNGNLPSTATGVTVGGTAMDWSINKSRISPTTNLKPAPDTDVSYQVNFCCRIR